MRHFESTIQPGNSIAETCVGNFLTVKQCSLPLTLTLGGSQQKTVKAGSVIPMDGQKNIGLTNGNAVAVTVSFEVDDKPGTFVADNNSTSNASTFAIANLGIAVNAAVNGALPACDANGYLQITNGAFYLISGKSNGHTRQQIVFSVSAGSLNVLTPDSTLVGNQFVFMTIPAGQVISLDSDTDWIVSGAGGLCKASIGQIFLNG